MNENPLLLPILTLLREHSDGISEYELLRQLRQQGLFDTLSLAEQDELALFQQHFLIMNALYRLQGELSVEGDCCLQISPLLIKLGSKPATDPALIALPELSGVAAYYLDWSHFHSTDAAQVRALLADFWRRLQSPEQRQQALQVLDLPTDSSQQQIRQRYRQLASQHHPDRGGDARRFIQLREAYELLRHSPAAGQAE